VKGTNGKEGNMQGGTSWPCGWVVLQWGCRDARESGGGASVNPVRSSAGEASMMMAGER